MNSKQAKTLAAIFTRPTPKNINWTDIEHLFVAVGCLVLEGNGSRVRLTKDGVIGSRHRPHPDREAKRYQVDDAREFLTQIGVTP